MSINHKLVRETRDQKYEDRSNPRSNDLKDAFEISCILKKAMKIEGLTGLPISLYRPYDKPPINAACAELANSSP